LVAAGLCEAAHERNRGEIVGVVPRLCAQSGATPLLTALLATALGRFSARAVRRVCRWRAGGRAAGRFPIRSMRGSFTRVRNSQAASRSSRQPNGAPSGSAVGIGAGRRSGKSEGEVLSGIVIGPNDLAGSMGHIGRYDHPDVQKAIDVVITRARAANKFVGLGSSAEPSELADWAHRGVQWLLVGADFVLLRKGTMQTIAAARAELAQRPSR